MGTKCVKEGGGEKHWYIYDAFISNMRQTFGYIIRFHQVEKTRLSLYKVFWGHTEKRNGYIDTMINGLHSAWIGFRICFYGQYYFGACKELWTYMLDGFMIKKGVSLIFLFGHRSSDKWLTVAV